MTDEFARHDVVREATLNRTVCLHCGVDAPCSWNRLLDRAAQAEHSLGEVAKRAIAAEHRVRVLRAQYGNEDDVGEVPKPGEYVCPRCGHVVAANHTTEGCFGRLMQANQELRAQRNALARDLNTADADAVQRAWAALPGKVDAQAAQIRALESENLYLRVRLSSVGLTAQVATSALPQAPKARHVWPALTLAELAALRRMGRTHEAVSKRCGACQDCCCPEPLWCWAWGDAPVGAEEPR